MKRFAVVSLALALCATGLKAQTRLGPVGEAEGDAWSDACASPREIRVRAGYWVDAIQLVCQGGPMPRRGGSGGGEHVFTLEPGEQVRAIAGSVGGAYGPFIYSIRIVTDRRTSEEFGNGGPSHGAATFSFEVPPGSAFAGIFGLANDRLRQLGILVSPAAVPAAVKPPVSSANLAAGPVPANPGSDRCPQPDRACYDTAAPFQWMRGVGGEVPPEAGAIGEVMVGTTRRRMYVCRAWLRRGDQVAGSVNGSLQAGDTGCRVVVDAGRDRGGRRVLVAREYEVLLGEGVPGLWSAPHRESFGALQASALDSVPGYLCMKARAGSRGPVGRVGPGGSGCVVVMGGRVSVSPAYLIVVSGGS